MNLQQMIRDALEAPQEYFLTALGLAIFKWAVTRTREDEENSPLGRFGTIGGVALGISLVGANLVLVYRQGPNLKRNN